VIGEPTDRMRWLFDHMLAARKAAFDAIVPGATSADVDGAVNAYFEKRGFRHSDTVAVTEDGYELLTDYPDDLETLVIPANG
jgi:Xaa-Pro aminopeptidase